MKYKQRDELVSSLRELADFIEAKGIALPEMSVYATGYANVYTYDREKGYNIDSIATKSKMRTVARAFGDCIKDHVGTTFQLKKKFGVIGVTVSSNRDAICTKVVVGKKEVPKYRKYGTEVVDDVEWVCGDPLLAG